MSFGLHVPKIQTFNAYPTNVSAFDLAWSILKNDDMLEEYQNDILEEYHRQLWNDEKKHLAALWDEAYKEMPEWYTYYDRADEESAHELREYHMEEALLDAEEKDREYDADYWARKNSS